MRQGKRGNIKTGRGISRSSTGWVILENGKDIRKFGTIARRPGITKSGKNKGKTINRKVGTGGKEGVETGRDFIDWAKQEFGSEGLVLVVFAGMEYAAAVESKGFDVLSYSTILGDKLMKELELDKGAKYTERTFFTDFKDMDLT